MELSMAVKKNFIYNSVLFEMIEFFKSFEMIKIIKSPFTVSIDFINEDCTTD